MWKGEWKAWVFYWVGLPLIFLVLGAVAVAIVTSRHPHHDGPAWASRTLTEARVLDRHFKVVRALNNRAELEEFAAWFHRADEVAQRSGNGWTHKLDTKSAIDWTADWYKAFSEGGDAYTLLQMQIDRFLAESA